MANKQLPSLLSEHLKNIAKTLEGRKKYIKNEYQAYGLDLAKELGDWKNRSMYIRLARTIDRQILEKARYFVKDQPRGTIKTPYKLFLWKLKELRAAAKEAQKGDNKKSVDDKNNPNLFS